MASTLCVIWLMMICMPFGILFEMLHQWTNLLGHVARGQGDKFDWYGGELRIASPFGGTWSTACIWWGHGAAAAGGRCFGTGWRSMDLAERDVTDAVVGGSWLSSNTVSFNSTNDASAKNQAISLDVFIFFHWNLILLQAPSGEASL